MSDSEKHESEEQLAGQSTRKHIRGSSLLFAGRIISIGIKFVLQILIVRYLTKSDYGAFAYAISLVEIAAILSLVSLDSAGSRFMPIFHEAEDYDSLFGFIILSFVTVFGVGLAIILLIFGLQGLLLGTVINDPLIISILLILIILAPLQAMDSWFQSLFAAFDSVKSIFFRRYIVWPGFQLLAILFVMFTGSGVIALAWGYFVGGVVGTSMYGYMMYQLFTRKDLLRHFSWGKIKYNAREIFGFSIPTLSSGFALILRTQLVIILLEFFKDTDSVAEFRAVLPIAYLNMIVYSSFVFLYMPLVARMLTKNDDEGINDLYWRTSAWISLASLPIFLVTFALANSFVPFIFEERYASSGSVLAVLSLGLYMNAILGFNLHTLRVYGVVKYLLIVDIITMIVSIGAYIYFIPLYGALGGAIAYAIALIFLNICNHAGLYHYTNINLFDWSYLRIYVMIVIVTIVLWLFQYTFDPSIFISIPVAAVMSLAILYINRGKLQAGEIFPELLKVPILRNFL